MIKLSEVTSVQPEWFSLENMRFFGDKEYFIMTGGKTGRPFLIRKTQAWTDMFSKTPYDHYCINSLDDALKIGEIVKDEKGLPQQFDNTDEVRVFLNQY
jgi:hypothetical protein